MNSKLFDAFFLQNVLKVFLTQQPIGPAQSLVSF